MLFTKEDRKVLSRVDGVAGIHNSCMRADMADGRRLGILDADLRM